MYPGVILFATSMLCAFLFGGLVLFFDRGHQISHFRRIALLLSIVTIALVVLGLCVELSQKGNNIDFSEILFKAAAPLATISGFYMVYQNFILQKQYNEDSEIRD